MLPHYLGKSKVQICYKLQKIEVKNCAVCDEKRDITCDIAKWILIPGASPVRATPIVRSRASTRTICILCAGTVLTSV